MSNPFFGAAATLPATGARLGRRGSGCLRSYALLAPATLLFVVFMFYPLAYTFYLSFFDWNMTRPTKEFVGLENYISVFTDPNFGKIMGNTALYILLLLLFDFAAPYVFSFILVLRGPEGEELLQGSHFPAQRHLAGGGDHDLRVAAQPHLRSGGGAGQGTGAYGAYLEQHPGAGDRGAEHHDQLEDLRL